MSRKIVLFGGSFNPPSRRQRQVADTLSRGFAAVVVVPRGPHPERPVTNDVETIFRATLAVIGFDNLPKVEIDLSDLEQGICSSLRELEARYEGRGSLWHFVSCENIRHGGDRRSTIQRDWPDGAWTWEHLKFVIPSRGVNGRAPTTEDLPPHHQLVDLPTAERGCAEIRDRIFRRESVAHLVTPEVSAYLNRYGLYRGRVPSRVTRINLSSPRWQVFADERNAKALSLAQDISGVRVASPGADNRVNPSLPEVPIRPNAILVSGGDGTMLKAIRQHWQNRVPFFGVNAGHLGFLLNDAESVRNNPVFHQELILRQMPLLYVETQETAGGPWQHEFAFNDAWVERSTSQSAWIEVSVGGRVRLPQMVCDGALVSTASGSTAYAQSMGATPLLADTPAWLLVGSNVMRPSNWKSALLGVEQEVILRNLDDDKRPLCAYVDGVARGVVHAIRARMSRTAAVELAFLPSHDMAEKIARIQFPPVE